MFKDRLERAWAAGLAVVVGGLSLHPLHESDAFWHLTLGRAVLAHGSRTVPEPSALPDFAQTVVVPEWLWEVATYGLHQWVGPEGLSLLVALLSGICALCVIWMLRSFRPDASTSAVMVVATLVLAVLMARMRLRPQLAYLILLPSFIVTTRAYLVAEGQRRLRLAGGLVAMVVLWAQLHGSFVIAPAIFGLLLLPQIGRDWFSDKRTLHLAVGLGLAVAIFSSADGAWVVHYVLVHASGDAARHAADMRPPTWSDLNPVASPFSAAYWLLWALVLLGMGRARRIDPGAVLLALFGVAMSLNSVRFIATGALLLGPLALDAAHALTQRVPGRVPRGALVAVASLAMLLSTGAAIHQIYGPLGRIGFAERAGAQSAARYLERLPAGSAVLSTFSAGASLGFASEGRLRTYVDTRTPLHFDDSDYAVAREVWQRPASLALALERYGAAGLVTARQEVTCDIVPSGWVPVVVEPAFTTFTPAAGTTEPLLAIAPCGADFLTSTACLDGGARLDAEIARMAALRESAFVDFLRASRIVRCGGDPAVADSLMPERRQVWSYRKPWALERARLDLALGLHERVLERMSEPARLGDLQALEFVRITQPSLSAYRQTLESAVKARDDDTPVAVRAELARVCVELDDADCVRFHGIRAAVSGSSEAVPLLAWLGANHPDERVRTDSIRWLATLAGRRGEDALTPLAASAPSR